MLAVKIYVLHRSAILGGVTDSPRSGKYVLFFYFQDYDSRGLLQILCYQHICLKRIYNLKNTPKEEKQEIRFHSCKPCLYKVNVYTSTHLVNNVSLVR